jgi:uncharacterized protein (TIGR03435 family)
MTPRLLAALHLGPLLLTLAITAPSAFAQAEDTYAPSMKFGVIELHDSDATETCDLTHAFVLGTSAFGVSNCDLTSLVAQAYGMRRDQVVGLPDEIFTYDVLAKANQVAEANIAKLAPKQQQLEQHHMLQEMLADRFGLKVHSESRTARSYDLVVGRRGPMMNPAAGEETDLNGKRFAALSQGNEGAEASFVVAHSAGMDEFASLLSGQCNRTVFDKTGLTGKYDFDLHYRGILSHDHDAVGADGLLPLDEAIQSQLGLRLKPSRGLELFLVVDHVDKPALD